MDNGQTGLSGSCALIFIAIRPVFFLTTVELDKNMFLGLDSRIQQSFSKLFLSKRLESNRKMCNNFVVMSEVVPEILWYIIE